MAKDQILAVGLSARRTLCIHPEVQSHNSREKVDSECSKLTADWAREDPNLPSCKYFEELAQNGQNKTIPSGIYTIPKIRQLGGTLGVCPYYLTRQLLSEANVIVCTYPYLLDGKTQSVLEKEIDPKKAIVVFDEAHNIDNYGIDAYSVKLNKGMMEEAKRSLERVETRVANKSSEV